MNGLDEAIARAREGAGGKDVRVMGGADTIRQALRAGYVEELSVSIAPVVLGGGKRLFEGFAESLNLEPMDARCNHLRPARDLSRAAGPVKGLRLTKRP